MRAHTPVPELPANSTPYRSPALARHVKLRQSLLQQRPRKTKRSYARMIKGCEVRLFDIFPDEQLLVEAFPARPETDDFDGNVPVRVLLVLELSDKALR